MVSGFLAMETPPGLPPRFFWSISPAGLLIRFGIFVLILALTHTGYLPP